MRQFLLFILCALPLRAGLEFPKKEIIYTCSPADAQAVVAFSFTNTGDKSITITQISSNCGCTAGQLEKKTYAPKESGEITLVFKFGERTGPQRKLLYVRTDADKDIITLALQTTIPELLKIAPQLLVFTRGLDEPKTIEITSPLPVQTLSIAPQEGIPTPSISKISPTHWKITVPPPTKSPSRTALELNATFAEEISKKATLWVLAR